MSIKFSSDQNHNTAKGLIGISIRGPPSFVTSLNAGQVSEKRLPKTGILKF